MVLDYSETTEPAAVAPGPEAAPETGPAPEPAAGQEQ